MEFNLSPKRLLLHASITKKTTCVCVYRKREYCCRRQTSDNSSELGREKGGAILCDFFGGGVGAIATWACNSCKVSQRFLHEGTSCQLFGSFAQQEREREKKR